MPKHDTPMLDQLESGPWPSFVTDIKRQAEKNEACWDILGQLELSFKDKITHWKHGGIVGVFGYGGGIVGRYSDCADKFPGVAHFHTVRVNQPSSKFYSSEILRKIMGIWDRRGSGMTNMHGSTGDMVLLGTFTEELEEIFYELTHDVGVDLGGSGGNLRTPSCCLGKARCEWSCYDTQAACHDITMTYQDELHRPAFPYKFKIKFSGCPNDCVAAIARSDMLICVFDSENPKRKDHVDFLAPFIQRFNGESLVVVINKCDRQDELEYRFGRPSYFSFRTPIEVEIRGRWTATERIEPPFLSR